MAILVWLPATFATLALFLLSRLSLETAWTVERALRARLQKRAARALFRLVEERVTTNLPVQRRFMLPRRAWACIGAGVALALVWRHVVLSPWFLVLGFALAWVVMTTRQQVQREDLRNLESFVSSLRSVLAVDQSIFLSLKEATQDLDKRGSLRAAVEVALRRYAVNPDREHALAALKEVGWPHLARLAVILTNVGFSDARGIQDALVDLEQQVRRTRLLRDRAESVLVLSRLTLRALQAANIAAVLVATILPMWRQYYVARPAVMVLATGLAALGSWYFTSEVRRIEELL